MGNLTNPVRFYPLLILAAGFAAYANSFSGAFVLDDIGVIIRNPNIRQLFPLQLSMMAPAGLDTLAHRPILSFSFALNYALGGLQTFGYHLLNLGIHLAAACTLFGILRRTFSQTLLKARYGSAAAGLALAVALIWVVHPLQTQSVTYVVQRAESLMGLFYLLALYGFIRAVQSNRSSFWSAAALAAAAAGMATKEVMVTAPILILLYDRIFLAGSFKQLFQERSGLHAKLMATWLLIFILAKLGPVVSGAGFGFEHLSMLDYLKSQAGVLLHYLKLVVWPHPLILDYDWPVARELGQFLPQLFLLLGLSALLIWKGKPRSAAVFGVICFFLILSPTSSILVIPRELIAEHRMYLPLAAVLTFLVVAVHNTLERLMVGEGSAAIRRWAGIVLTAAVVGSLTGMTFRRNQDYASTVVMWQDVVEKRPQNRFAINNLAVSLAVAGRLKEAQIQLSQLAELYPGDLNVQLNLAKVFSDQKKFEHAIVHYLAAQEISPARAQTKVLLEQTLDKGIDQIQERLKTDPENARLHSNLGAFLAQQGSYGPAIAHLRRALEIQPQHHQARQNLDKALEDQAKSSIILFHTGGGDLQSGGLPPEPAAGRS